MVHFTETSGAERLLAVYEDLPALRLSLVQAARLSSLPVAECEVVLHQLVAAGVLYRSRDGRYAANRRTALVGSAIERGRAV